ncbi:hypothetical protein AsAng_0035460 [Aureispira anguillae]|uniref:Uncharacterized protein n=1 Tax=Aureispira anguillae TaxID=2864201 RepID=A0A916DV60_9BACT|nr:hypothetical protein AsAng_0035460 [Aureispira anguillae]
MNHAIELKDKFDFLNIFVLSASFALERTIGSSPFKKI